MKFTYILILNFYLLGILTFAQRPKPAPHQSRPIVIQGATIHTGTGEVLNNANLIFKDGIITGFGKEIPANAEIINAVGKHVYPGFILVNNTLGLVEIAATNATVDFKEANNFTPEVRTLIAFNTDSHIIPTIRTNGVLLTQPVMKQGILTGTSSVMNLDAWNWEDAVVAKDNGLHLFWPRDRDYIDPKREKEAKEQREKNIRKINNLFKRAKAYKNPEIKDFKLESIAPIFTGNKKLYIQIPGADEGLEVLSFIDQLEIPEVVWIGGSSLLPILDHIKNADIPLIIHRPHSLPHDASSSPNLSYEFAKLVHDKGILYGLDYSGDMEYHGGRNLPFVAGTTVAYGIDKEVAIQSISYNLAKILGIDKKYGSLEKGKSATLFISEGDALDALSNEVTHAFIDGRKIDLNNQQKELYNRYKEKYRQDRHLQVTQ
ncbi:amidohydrolase family protein [Flavobacteriaceae bacterium Ap0902]|nr:amidohydrolase family protein [Flavobacteriaceae bacterium Ap0902]